MAVNTATKFNVAPALSVPYQSSDATARVAAYFDATPYPLSLFWFEVKVLAIYADGSLGGTYWRQAAFRSDADGVLTQIDATNVIGTDLEDTAGMEVTVAIGSPVDSGSGTGTDDNQIQVTVTGVAATAINWVLDNTIRHAPFSR